MFNPHEILGVDEGEDFEVIRKRFKTVSKMFHPDKHQNDKSAIVIYQIIKSSYDSLKASKTKIVLPVMDPQITDKTNESQSEPKQSLVPGTNITENDIRILGEKLNDPWFHPQFDLTDMFGDVNIPKEKKDKEKK